MARVDLGFSAVRVWLVAGGEDDEGVVLILDVLDDSDVVVQRLPMKTADVQKLIAELSKAKGVRA